MSIIDTHKFEEFEEPENPILQTITLIEDRLDEIHSEGHLNLRLSLDGLPTVEYLDATEKYKFLRELSTNLARFHAGVYLKD